MAFVLDTSLAVSWCFEDEATSYTEAVLDCLVNDEAFVPAIWLLEVANVLLVAERRGRITQAQTLRFVQLLQALPIRIDGGDKGSVFGPVLALARERGLSAYDASYIDLAARHGIALATKDARMSEAASRVGVPLFSA